MYYVQSMTYKMSTFQNIELTKRQPYERSNDFLITKNLLIYTDFCVKDIVTFCMTFLP